MSDNSRDKRLGSGTKLLDAVQALDNVGKDHRAEYLHDRLMSAIDSICEERQGTAVKPLFSPAQLDIIKDVSFHIVYILHHKPEKKLGVIKAFWKDYCSQGPIKMLTLGVSAAGAVILALGFLVVQTHNFRAGGFEAVWASFFGPKDQPIAAPKMVAPAPPTPPGPRTPSLVQPTMPTVPLPTGGAVR